VSRSVTVLGLDLGLAKLGWCRCDLWPDRVVPVAMGCVETKKSDKKLKFLSGDDDFRRTREIASFLLPKFDGVEVVTLEGASWPRNNRSCQLIGRSWGIIGALVTENNLPVNQVSPQAIKKKLCGANNASKDQVQTALDEMFEYQLTPLLEGLPKGKWEHPYDALGSVVASLDSDVIRMARKMVTGKG